METSKLWSLCAETYKGINSINLPFINEIFRASDKQLIERFVVSTFFILQPGIPKVNQVNKTIGG